MKQDVPPVCCCLKSMEATSAGEPSMATASNPVFRSIMPNPGTCLTWTLSWPYVGRASHPTWLPAGALISIHHLVTEVPKAVPSGLQVLMVILPQTGR